MAVAQQHANIEIIVAAKITTVVVIVENHIKLVDMIGTDTVAALVIGHTMIEIVEIKTEIVEAIVGIDHEAGAVPRHLNQEANVDIPERNVPHHMIANEDLRPETENIDHHLEIVNIDHHLETENTNHRPENDHRVEIEHNDHRLEIVKRFV